MVTPDEAAQLCRVTTRTIYRRVEAEKLHLKETESGFSLICLDSIERNQANWAQEPNHKEASKFSKGFFKEKLMKRILKRH